MRREGGETRILIKVFHQHAHLFQYFRRLSHALTAISDHLIFPRETTLLSASHQHLSATNCASNCLFCARGSRCPPLRWDCVRRTRWAAPSRRLVRPSQIWNGPRRGISGNLRQDTSSRSDLEPRRDGRLSLRLKLPLIASNCLSCARGSSAMRPPAIASAVAVTLARTGNLRFQTTTIHKQERHGKARSSSPGAPQAPWRARFCSQGAPCQPPTRRSLKTCEWGVMWGFGAGVGF